MPQNTIFRDKLLHDTKRAPGQNGQGPDEQLTFLVIMALGQFQGVIMPTTPMGWRIKIISLEGVGLWATCIKYTYVSNSRK